MGMSTHIVGFIPPDEDWKKMKQVWDACETAGIEVPEPVRKFFNWEIPDEQGVEIHLAVTGWTGDDDTSEGFELEVDKIPPNVKVIRFYNSW